MLVAYVGCNELIIVEAKDEIDFLKENFTWFMLEDDNENMTVQNGHGFKHYQDYKRQKIEKSFVVVKTEPSII